MRADIHELLCGTASNASMPLQSINKNACAALAGKICQLYVHLHSSWSLLLLILKRPIRIQKTNPTNMYVIKINAVSQNY